MVCGYLPFEDANTSALYKKILAANYKLPKFVSQEAADLMRKILNPDPTKRFVIDDIRKHQWFNLYKVRYLLIFISVRMSILIGKGLFVDIIESRLIMQSLTKWKNSCISNKKRSFEQLRPMNIIILPQPITYFSNRI